MQMKKAIAPNSTAAARCFRSRSPAACRIACHKPENTARRYHKWHVTGGHIANRPHKPNPPPIIHRVRRIRHPPGCKGPAARRPVHHSKPATRPMAKGHPPHLHPAGRELNGNTRAADLGAGSWSRLFWQSGQAGVVDIPRCRECGFRLRTVRFGSFARVAELPREFRQRRRLIGHGCQGRV